MLGIEEIGAIVRGQYGQLVRIVSVYEESRASPNHISIPSAVVVATEAVGPGYGHRSSWSSDLTLAEAGDIGAHPCSASCSCGDPFVGPGYGIPWIHRSASWQK